MNKGDYIEVLIDDFIGAHLDGVIKYTFYKKIYPVLSGDSYRTADRLDYMEEVENSSPIDWEDFTKYVLEYADGYIDFNEPFNEANDKKYIQEEINLLGLYNNYLNDNEIQMNYLKKHLD